MTYALGPHKPLVGGSLVLTVVEGNPPATTKLLLVISLRLDVSFLYERALGRENRPMIVIQ